MFEEFSGVPSHPLLVHAAVVFIPLLAIMAGAYALAPFIRPHIRWVLGALAVATPGAALFAKLSGDAFFARLRGKDMISPEVGRAIAEHRDLGNLTLISSLVLAAAALALVYLVRPALAVTLAPEAAAPAPVRPARAVALGLSVVVVLAAVVSLYFVVRTGDSGAKAVWTGF